MPDTTTQVKAILARTLRELEQVIDNAGIACFSAVLERALAMQAEVSYKRMVADQQAGAPARKVGASATPERAST